MQKVKVIVRNFQKKDGSGNFTKITIGGKYIDDILADESVNYQVKFTKKSQVQEPKDDGIYEVAYNNGEAWIDTRDEDKHIFRITAQKVKFNKPLPKLDKDVRLTALPNEEK